MRLFIPLLFALASSSAPLLAAPSLTKTPPQSSAPRTSAYSPILAPAVAAAAKIREAQKTVKPNQKFNLVADDPRLAPSLEFNDALLKVVSSPTETALQKREALKLWNDFYQESSSWKPYYFLGTLVPNETMEKLRDFAFSQVQMTKGAEAQQLARYFSSFAIFAYDNEQKWNKAKAQELLAANEKGVLREWALQVRMMDRKAPLADRLTLYRELMALPKPIFATHDYYFTSFNSSLSFSTPEEKEASTKLKQEVFDDPKFSAKTRFDVATSLSVDAKNSTDKIAIYNKAMKIAGLETVDKWSLLYWRGDEFARTQAYDKALQSFDEAIKLAGGKLPRQRADANFAAAKLHTETLKKPADARPYLNALAGDENLMSDDMLQVVLWRANLELGAKENLKARQIIESSLSLKKLSVQQKDFLRFQLAQLLVADSDHVAAIELIDKIPVQNLNPQVQQNGFDSMFGQALSLKNFDGAKALIDLWSKRGGLGLLNYTILNGLIFESRGNLPGALAVYKAVLPSITIKAEKDYMNGIITKLEARIAAAKPQVP